MITEVNAKTAGGQLLNLPFESTLTGYFISEIEGLGPVKADFASSRYASMDGEYYQSSRRGARDIRIRLEFDPMKDGEPIEDLRTSLYRFFMTKSPVELEFSTSSGVSATINGYVEECMPAIFTRDPAMDISIRCFTPDFFSESETTITGQTVNTTESIVVPYSGTVETGIVFEIAPAQTMSDFVIVHTLPFGGESSMEFNSGLSAGERLLIDTNPGKRRAVKYAATSEASVMYGVSPTSKWVMLSPGENRIRVVSSVSSPYTIRFHERYGGL